MKQRFGLVTFLIVLFNACALAQDSVDVTFRWNISGQAGYSVPGEFNGWNSAAWPMVYQGGTLWTRSARLRVGGQPGGTVSGAYQYKFFYTGASPWPNDPLNHHVNAADNNNTFIIVKDPTFYQVLPNQRQGTINTGQPTVTAYIFPKVSASVDTSTLRVIIDGTEHSGIGLAYNPTTKQLSYTIPAGLSNGAHTMIIRAGTNQGGSNTDTVSFVSQAGYVQITNQSGFTTRNPTRALRGIVQNTSVTSIRMVRNGTDTTTVPVSSGSYSVTVNLVEGVNTFRAVADSAGTLIVSSPVSYTYLVSHAPTASISYGDFGSTIRLDGTSSTDPDSGQAATLTYRWSEDPSNPAPIGGINGVTTSTVTVNRPQVLGEYYFGLIVTDANGNSDTTRNYFILRSTPPILSPSLPSVPQWVREGRLYEMFFKSHTPTGTITAAIPDLNRIAAMGYNIIWLMPVMRNRYPINNGTGPGYDIIDFYTVAPEYGTNDDLRNFIDRAHQLGMKVILDITPNHSSAGHPFVLDARMFGRDSRYWPYYQHQYITYNGIGLGQLSEAMTADGFVYYGAFSDELLNLNYADLDLRNEMLNVHKYWLQSVGADGFRLDVYWGQHIRANSPNGGENEFGRPLRTLLKHVKPDIYLLGEATGVGPGTERIYADNSDARGMGGIESAYDWPLNGFNHDANLWIQTSATRVNGLDTKLRNGSTNAGMGYLPGPNSYPMRFLENHDEDRSVYLFGRQGIDPDSIARKRVMAYSAAVLLAVGMPEVYSGQESGWGLGVPDYDQRRRGVINWQSPQAAILMPHYQKLAQIRKQFPAFTTQQMVRATADVAGVYAYTRPLEGKNGLVITSLDGAAQTVNVTLTTGSTPPAVLGVTDGVQYVLSDLYNATSSAITFTGGTATVTATLPPYGLGVYVIDSVARTVVLPPLTGVEQTTNEVPGRFELLQNYPNPFNPSTTIQCLIPHAGHVTMTVFDLLGREVDRLIDDQLSPGTYTVHWDGLNTRGVTVGSGVYFYRVDLGDHAIVKRMLLVR
jgi:cyclomaltodextrinase / maltogenic alpha-amylase / neopullulanase